MSIGPTRDREAGIYRCACCNGYMRRFETRRMTCADVECPGHATGGVLTPEIAAAELAALEGRPCTSPR